MMHKVEHIGIAVKDLEQAEQNYTIMLGVAPYKREAVATEHVMTSFFLVGDTKIELLAATSEESAIYKFIDKKGEGIHHIAYGVDDIVVEMNRLREDGYTLLNDKPKRGADNKLICFVHPRDAQGVLTELCQEISDDQA
jgi:methylmalonyl-CoA/ethylmalonyl-CoA epimerase